MCGRRTHVGTTLMVEPFAAPCTLRIQVGCVTDVDVMKLTGLAGASMENANVPQAARMQTILTQYQEIVEVRMIKLEKPYNKENRRFLITLENPEAIVLPAPNGLQESNTNILRIIIQMLIWMGAKYHSGSMPTGALEDMVQQQLEELMQQTD